MEVRWLRSALRDFEGQIDFIAVSNAKAAARVGARTQASIAWLADHPELGRVGRVPETRELVITGTRFIAVYRITTAIEVLRIIHTSQHWPPRSPR